MTWTTETPTKPGWYWLRDLMNDTPICDPTTYTVVRLSFDLQGHTWVHDSDGFVQLSQRFRGSWAGPLEPPV
jgi:hypothetical protein